MMQETETQHGGDDVSLIPMDESVIPQFVKETENHNDGDEGDKGGEVVNEEEKESSEETEHKREDEPPRQTLHERVQIYEAALTIQPIDRKVIEKLAFRGIPDHPTLRSSYWKVLLNYHRDEDTQQFYANSRRIYLDFIQELILDPHAKYAKYQEERVEDVTMDDHPLSQNQTSIWNQYFADNDMMDEIDKDVRRTFPQYHFFNKDGLVGSTRHYESLKRILFIYAKLNPGIRYVQGMNEVLGPIYYIFATDPTYTSIDDAEADAFHCFTNLMSEIRDNFCKTLDNSNLGISANMKKLNQLLKQLDYELWAHLESQGMNPQFYTFRWLTLLLSQEFDLPDTIRLWDCLFSDPNRFEFLLYCCCAMLQCIRPKLMQNEFADNLKQLQNFPQDIEITTILRKAEELRNPPTPTPPHTPNRDNENHSDSPNRVNVNNQNIVNTNNAQNNNNNNVNNNSNNGNNLKQSKGNNSFFSRLFSRISENTK